MHIFYLTFARSYCIIFLQKIDVQGQYAAILTNRLIQTEVFCIKTQKYLYVVFLVLTVVMTILTLYDSLAGISGTGDSIFRSVWVVFILTAFVAIQVICLFTIKPKFTLYRAGFYLLHVGLVLLLIGCFVYYIAGDVVSVTVPVDDSALYNQIKREEADEKGNDLLRLDFYLGVSDFTVERYEAEDGLPASDKYYEATLRIMPEGTREVEEIELTVNHPHHEDGWKIYLMNYDRATESAVQLMLKYDPGEYVTLSGIWMIIAGVFVMCLFRKREAVAKK